VFSYKATDPHIIDTFDLIKMYSIQLNVSRILNRSIKGKSDLHNSPIAT